MDIFTFSASEYPEHSCLRKAEIKQNAAFDLHWPGKPLYLTNKIASALKKKQWKIQWSIISHQWEWPSSKNLQTINAGETVEKRESFCIIGVGANWHSHYGKHCGDSLKN